MKCFDVNIGNIRLLDVRIFDNDNLVYEGIIDNAPEEIKKWHYSKVEGMNPMNMYVYDEGKQ